MFRRTVLVAASLLSLVSAADSARFERRDYFLDQHRVVSCKSATTDTQVEFCAGETPADHYMSPLSFDCDKARSRDERAYCRKHPQFEARRFFYNRYGGVNSCVLASTDAEVSYCAGDGDNKSMHPSRFNCKDAEVQSEYDYCKLPYPRARRSARR